METGKGISSNQQHELQLAFITISDQNSVKDPAWQQLARTQAIKHSLQRKRQQRQLSANNFVDETPKTIVRRRKIRRNDDEGEVIELPQHPATFESCPVDPFDSLTVDARRLATLLRHSSARQAGEPIFSVNNAIDYQNLRSVFHAGLEDPALASALCLTLAFAANGGIMDEECSAYRLKAITHVSAKLSKPAEAASTTTIGTILLLVGIEACNGIRLALLL